MGILNVGDAKASGRRRRSELLLIGLVGLIGYVVIQAFSSETGRFVVTMALCLSVAVLAVLIGLLVRRLKDPVARERLTGLLRYAAPKGAMSRDEQAS